MKQNASNLEYLFFFSNWYYILYSLLALGVEVLKCSFSHCTAMVVNRNLFKCHLNVHLAKYKVGKARPDSQMY